MESLAEGSLPPVDLRAKEEEHGGKNKKKKKFLNEREKPLTTCFALSKLWGWRCGRR